MSRAPRRASHSRRRCSGDELVLVAPPGLRMGKDVLRSLGPQLRVRETTDLAEAAPTLDVLYQTRIQAERFESAVEYERYRGVYVVGPELMRRLPEHAILMHPLPRAGEIDPQVDADPRAAYFRQVRNGLWVRMAVLEWAMAG